MPEANRPRAPLRTTPRKWTTSRVVDNPATVTRLAQRLPTFQEFVEAALFSPRWGYYATGAVRFGDGGHYDTFPIALSPFFGRMVVRFAYRRWWEWGRPRRFELCEIGAGNGQLCLDALVYLQQQAQRDSDWRRFSQAFAYRIIEKSRALQRRQAAQLGSLASPVTWESCDLSQAPSRARQRPFGVVIANEVLDCLAHHKVVLGRDDAWYVAYVGASLDGAGASSPSGHLLSRRSLDAAVARHPGRLLFTEYLLPLTVHRPVQRFMKRHYPDIWSRPASQKRPWTYFACPAIETFVRNLARLHRQSDILLMDYGGDRDFHRDKPPSERLRAGRPEDNASIFRAPGHDDITFLVDFSVVATAAADAGLTVGLYGGQRHLARLGRMSLDSAAVELMIKQRALAWLLAVTGVGPESVQRRTALSWTKPPQRRRPHRLAKDVQDARDQFLGKRPSVFQLMLLQNRHRQD